MVGILLNFLKHVPNSESLVYRDCGKVLTIRTDNWTKYRSLVADPFTDFSEPVLKRCWACSLGNNSCCIETMLGAAIHILVNLPEFNLTIWLSMSWYKFFTECQTQILNYLILTRPKFGFPPCQSGYGCIASDRMLNVVTLLEIVNANDLISCSSSCRKDTLMVRTPCYSLNWAWKDFSFIVPRLAQKMTRIFSANHIT